MICHYNNTKSRSSPTAPTDIVTYRYNGELVYVPVSLNYNHALLHARDAFPQLKKLPDASISLSLTAPGHGRKLVGITAPAWPKLVAHMSRYQIVDVHVTQANGHGVAMPIPDITITYADAGDAEEAEPAPPYQGVDVMDEKASASYPRPRTLSTPTLHPGKRSWFFQKLHGQ